MDSRADDAQKPVDLGTYEKPPHGWTCFHCGETFTTLGGARDHFGATPDALPGCLIRVQIGDERGLEMALRKAEAEIARLRALSGAVPTDEQVSAMCEDVDWGLLAHAEFAHYIDECRQCQAHTLRSVLAVFRSVAASGGLSSRGEAGEQSTSR